MAQRVIVRPRSYFDSVRLMRISQAVRLEPGVQEAMAMMATPNNKKILAASGLLTAEAEAAQADDLVIGLTAEDEAQADAALAAATAALDARPETGAGGAEMTHRTLDAAVSANPDASVALISVPGAYATREARRALQLGLNVFMFSDNVPLEDELALKTQAQEAGRLMMGPDCGTAILNGVALGFANVVARGGVGVVGASGTGTQEITSALDWMGVGVSQAIGTGGRDLSDTIGGLTTLAALDILATDDATRVIVITSKPPAAEVAEKVIARCREIGKPVVVNFVGAAPRDPDGMVHFADTLSGAAEVAARLGGGITPLPALPVSDVAAYVARMRKDTGQGDLRGLYAGGTLAYEALHLIGDRLGPVASNLSKGDHKPADPFVSAGHTVIDLGEDEYTEGRAHPMIDPYVRNQRLLREAADPSCGLILMDVVLGYGAHDDPAADLAPVLAQACAAAKNTGRTLPIIVTLCGTAGDPQDYARQAATLSAVSDDILITRTNAEAVRIAIQIMEPTNGQ